MKLSLLRRILIHVLFWSIYIGFLLSTDIWGVALTSLFYTTILPNFFVFIPSTYATYFLALKPYSNGGNLVSTILWILAIMIWFVTLQFIYARVVNSLGLTNIFSDFTPSIYLCASAAQQYFLYYFLFALSYWYGEKAIINERKSRIAETEKLTVEYNYLKSQINPHFLYNTLSFFYSRLLKQDKETANGLAALSDIMRYSLTAGNSEGKVPLEQEVEQIENYISLQQMRFSNNLHIQFDYVPNGQHGKFLIIPHSLITLVENAFKHGIADDPDYPLQLRLATNENSIFFSTNNKKAYRENDKGGGIGLKNLKERLELAHTNKYSLLVKKDDTSYNIELTILL